MISNRELEKQIGERVRMARLMAGMSQQQLATVCGNLTFQQFQKYENGANRVSVSRLLEIAKATGQPIAFFIPDESAPADAPASGAALGLDKLDLDIARLAASLPTAAKASVRAVIRALLPDQGDGREAA